MHELAAGQDTQNSWPVGITGFGLGVTDHPGTAAPADAAGAAFTDAAAPPASPGNSAAAAAATVARRIRPRIATPCSLI
jgi:hypothetical protein